MSYKQIQSIIPFDYLHWNEDQNEWTALSVEEIDALIEVCHDSGVIDPDAEELGEEDIAKIMRVMTWATEAKMGEILLAMIKNGTIDIILKDNDPEVYFKQRENK